MPELFKTSILLQIFIEHSDNFSEDFIKYDTAIIPCGFYKLPKNKYLILIFESFSMRAPSSDYWNTEIWTTIRRWTPQKEKYYRSKIGQQFEVVIEEKG